jgi:hypothetical protein
MKRSLQPYVIENDNLKLVACGLKLAFQPLPGFVTADRVLFAPYTVKEKPPSCFPKGGMKRSLQPFVIENCSFLFKR